MVFKKPYAFLIKYFKLINFILSTLAIYIAYRTYNIISFFNEYILNDYSGNYFKGFSEQYISPIVYFILLIIFVGILSIYLLLRYKKKPAKIYLFSLLYDLIFIIFLFFIKNVMVTLETTVITAETARLYRDISVLIFMPQIPLIISFILRGLGFNTKKLNFEKDLKELEISEQDSEEIEITLKKDDVKLKRNIHRFFREFKYYVKENKFIFIILCVIVISLLIFGIYKSLPTIVDRNYNQGENFIINNLNYKIEDSIITNLNYKGDYLDNKKYYVVVRMTVENTTNDSVVLDYNNFRLIVNNKYIYPIIDKSRNFIDYASDYYSEEIKANSNNTYSIVYEIDESELKKNYKIKIFNGSTVEKKLKIAKYNYINITPIVINKIIKEQAINLNEEISFLNSNLGNTKLTLSNAIITDKYYYNYNYCVKENCSNYKDIINIDYTVNDTTLIVMDYKYEIDNTVPFYKYSKSINTFAKTFMKVKYLDNNNEEVYADIKEVTPNKLKDKIVIETTNEIKNSNQVEISIIIRNKEYSVRIK